jgi:aryl-alcohol dehydrogenase-like predicted oxidoreductase
MKLDYVDIFYHHRPDPETPLEETAGALAQAAQCHVIASCRRRGIDPWEYVRDVLRRLPAMKQSQAPTLLPRCWKPSDKLAN